MLTLLQTVIGVNPWVVHRNSEIFGDDVESFNPERWLGDTSAMGTISFTRPIDAVY